MLTKASSASPLQSGLLFLQLWTPNSPSLSATGLSTDEATSGGMPVERRTEGETAPPPLDRVSPGAPDANAHGSHIRWLCSVGFFQLPHPVIHSLLSAVRLSAGT